VKICLLLLEFLLVMHLAADHVKGDTGLDESVRANRLTVVFASPLAISTFAVDTSDREVGNQHADSLREFGVCPIIEVDTYRVR
jgi:hypothetical protein